MANDIERHEPHEARDLQVPDNPPAARNQDPIQREQPRLSESSVSPTSLVPQDAQPAVHAGDQTQTAETDSGPPVGDAPAKRSSNVVVPVFNIKGAFTEALVSGGGAFKKLLSQIPAHYSQTSAAAAEKNEDFDMEKFIEMGCEGLPAAFADHVPKVVREALTCPVPTTESGDQESAEGAQEIQHSRATSNETPEGYLEKNHPNQMSNDPKQTPDEGSTSAPQESSHQTSDNTSKEADGGTSDQTALVSSSDTPQEASHRATSDAPDQAVNNISTERSQDQILVRKKGHFIRFYPGKSKLDLRRSRGYSPFEKVGGIKIQEEYGSGTLEDPLIAFTCPMDKKYVTDLLREDHRRLGKDLAQRCGQTHCTIRALAHPSRKSDPDEEGNWEMIPDNLHFTFGVGPAPDQILIEGHEIVTQYNEYYTNAKGDRRARRRTMKLTDVAELSPNFTEVGHEPEIEKYYLSKNTYLLRQPGEAASSAASTSGAGLPTSQVRRATMSEAGRQARANANASAARAQALGKRAIKSEWPKGHRDAHRDDWHRHSGPGRGSKRTRINHHGDYMYR